MQRELTITLSDDTYALLITRVGKKNMSQFIESVLLSQIKNGSSEIYDVKLPATRKNHRLKIHSPRLVDRSLAEKFKMKIIEENENGKL